ncbi:MAG: hypothetical protein JWP36_2616 [Paucimonas sp.]|nr:hypothetical protein [Paucimonas sp.]
MTETEFRALCRAASLALNLADADQLHDCCQVVVDGVDIGLVLDHSDKTQLLHCYVDIGAFDAVRHPDALAELLKLNLYSGSKTHGVFAMDPVSERALLVSHLPLHPGLTGERLAAILRAYAGTATDLRTGLLQQACLPPLASGAAQVAALAALA